MSLEQRAFAPINARLLAVVRIGVGVAALMELIPSAMRMAGLAAGDAVRLPVFGPAAWLVEFGWPLIVLAWLVGGVAFAVGWRTRLAGATLALAILAVVLGDEQLYSNHAYLLVITVAILSAGDAGSSLSLDARRLGTDASPAPAWTLFALRLQLSIVYLFTGIAKLNASFLSGSVIANAMRREGPLTWPEAWLSFEVMFLMSILVVGSELFLAFGLWRARWRPIAFLLGVLLHVGVIFVMEFPWDLAAFSALTLALYVPFLDVARGSRTVVWDDSCGFCATWVRWFRRLDWLDALRFVPLSRLATTELPVTESAALEALHVVGPRRVSRGFAAVTDVAAVLPLSFLWAALLRLPPIAAIGERAYRSVARSRTCSVRPADAAGVS